MAEAQTPRIAVFRDVLDKQLVDRSGEKIGKADGVIADAASGRLEAIEAGAPTLARRLNEAWARAVERRAAAWKAPLLRSARVAFREVLDVDLDVKVDVDGERTPLRAGERWLADRVVGRMPGAGTGGPREKPGDPRPPARLAEEKGEIRLELALGRRVRAGNNRPVGRLEEVRAEKRGNEWYAREIHIGPAALLERLSAATRLLAGLERKRKGRVARWSDVDLSDPRRPRLRVPASELRPFTDEDRLEPPARR